MLNAFLHGLILAFGLIIPLGVQNVFVFNQGATQKPFIRALPVVVTASLCDTLLIIVAVLGLTLLLAKFFWLKESIYAVGFCFLVYMGYVTWNSTPKVADTEASALPAKKQVLFALSVSLLNPHAILDTIGVIGTNSLSFVGTAKVAFAMACILISWLWFFGLAIAGHILHRLDTHGTWLKLINKLSALIIWGVALYMGSHLVQEAYAPHAIVGHPPVQMTTPGPS